MIPEEINLPGVRQAELITDRRGARTWKVTRADGSMVALKYAVGEARPLARREANVLRVLGNSDVIARGVTQDGEWLACSWWDAPTLHQTWKGVRTTNTADDQAVAATATAHAATVLAGLHAAGWRHCDLQADHILILDHDPVRLLDFALAQGPVEVEPYLTYRGGLAHLAAPEIAGELLATPADHHVTVPIAAEVYMFGAVLFTVWSRQWPHEYASERPSVEDIYVQVSLGRARRSAPDGWPYMSALISAAMDREAANRPTMAEIGATLSAAGSRQ